MKYDSVSDAEQVVWQMRLCDVERGENRAILDRLFDGHPPYTRAKAEENHVQVNRNFLTGTNLLSQGRAQWNSAMLKQQNYFGVTLDSGPVFKRQAWGEIITRNINRQLKGCRAQMEQVRAEGAMTILHGIGPSTFKNRRSPVPNPLPVSSLMIPSQTDIDFENLEYFAVFREYTPSQLYAMTHGPKVDPGWNMDAVNAQWEWVREQYQKEPSSTAFQYMPERIEELIKEGGIWGTDAVPTVDVWDFYFRQADDGEGWYRRVFLDWGVTVEKDSKSAPQTRNTSKAKDYGGFLYTSGKRKYASHLSEILQCQFGDCSAVAPFKYHSVRSLGWMLWGVCEIENRLRCRLTENMFMNMMWWFRCTSQGDFDRVKKAMFEQIGVIPAGIQMLTDKERFKPDAELYKIFGDSLKETMQTSAGSFIGNPSDIGKEETATGTMARVHSVNAMMGGMLTLAYEYAKYKYREQARRFCIRNSPYKMPRDFRLACVREGVPEDFLDAAKWRIEPDRALGDGNKILEMAIAQGLQNIRKNLGPDAQRKVDHLYIASLTDRPDLAEDLAPIEHQKKLSPSTHDAQLSTDRLMRGLPYGAIDPKSGMLELSPEMVPEDYVLQWLADMGAIIKQVQGSGNVGTLPQVTGLANMGTHIGAALKTMQAGQGSTGKGHDQDEKKKIRSYSDALSKLMNFVKGFAQRLQEKMQKGNGHAGPDPEALAKIQADQLKAASNLRNKNQSHQQKLQQTAQRFQLEQQLKAGETAAEIRRENVKAGMELAHDHLKRIVDAHHSMLSESEPEQESGAE